MSELVICAECHNMHGTVHALGYVQEEDLTSPAKMAKLLDRDGEGAPWIDATEMQRSWVRELQQSEFRVTQFKRQLGIRP